MANEEEDEALLDGMGGINRLGRMLNDLDERGLVLSLAAFAEDSLGDLLRAFMRSNEAADDLINGFNAPLGTFSTRNKAACALGLITDEQFRDIEHLRKIRNAFSHTWKPVSFGDQNIRDRITKINYSSLDDNYPETAEEKLRSAGSALLIELRIIIEQIGKRHQRTPLIGHGLIAGLSGDVEEQIETAEQRLTELESNLAIAEGTKREFLLMLQRRWLQRLRITESRAGERAGEVREMIRALERRIAASQVVVR